MRVLELSAWRNRSKITGRTPGAIPCPVSLTTISTCELIRCRCTWIRPPFGVNFTALMSRFHTICCRRLGSPVIGPARGSSTLWTRMPLASAASRTASSAASTTAVRSTLRTSSRILPVMTRETSSRSSTSWTCALALRSMTSSARVIWVSPVICPVRSMRAQP